jgi:hypothetical protein
LNGRKARWPDVEISRTVRYDLARRTERNIVQNIGAPPENFLLWGAPFLLTAAVRPTVRHRVQVRFLDKR